MKRGFTLVELLVVIAIISILSVVGIVVFTGVQKSARDSKRRSDIDAISKAYEAKYSTSYQSLTEGDFASGIPKDPSGEDYFNVINQSGSGYKVCAALEANPSDACNTPAANCFCRSSSQGSIATGDSLSGPHADMGAGGGSSSSCDRNGTLLSGLIGYWDLNGSTLDKSGKGNNGTITGGVTYSNDTVQNNIFGQSGNFDGTGYVRFNLRPYPIFPTIHGPSSVSLWFKASSFSGTSALFSDSCTEFGIDHSSSTVRGIAYSYLNGGNVSTGAWHHAVLTHEHPGGLTGTKAKFYVDGIEKASTTLNITTQQNGYQDDPFAIGTDPNFGCNTSQAKFTGLIDDVRLYNRALFSAEVGDLYNSGSGCIP